MPQPEETSTEPDLKGGHFETTIPVDSANGGRLESVEYLLISCSTYATPHLPMAKVADGLQPQQAFSLPGWDLTLALVRTDPVVKAVPKNPDYLTEEEIDQLNLRLFNLLSFLVSREVGIGPIAGLNDNGQIVWAHFSSSRTNKRTCRIGVNPTLCPERSAAAVVII